MHDISYTKLRMQSVHREGQGRGNGAPDTEGDMDEVHEEKPGKGNCSVPDCSVVQPHVPAGCVM